MVQPQSNIPLGLCQCGCGQPTKISTRNDTYRQHKKGVPKLYILGHGTRGRSMPAEQRFWQYVSKTDTCWLWTGAHNPSGYGLINKKAGSSLAHRVSWLLHCGIIPEGVDVCHICDNPPCVNPGHLFLGTRQDNMSDSKRKGRNATGARHGRRRLSAEEVVRIRQQYAGGHISHRQLASDFGVTHGTIGHILRGQTWIENTN